MSKFTSILGNIGKTAALAAGDYFHVGDIVRQLFKTAPTPPDGNVAAKFADAYHIIKTAEFMFGAASADGVQTGPQKLAAVTPYISEMFMAIEDFSGKKPDDPVEFNLAMQDIAKGFVRAANAFKK
jgi:hypothetical protein